MLINADFSQRASLASEDHHWIQSPQNGVERVMLDRVGAEKARATSLVRYAPNSYFPHHLHPGGEEILVLSGTFSADDTHYPAGWYLRNPPSSGHRPYSDEGAVIFVKLRQMSSNETHHVAIDTYNDANWQQRGNRRICPLFSDGVERVSLQRINAGELLFIEAVDGGAEILVVAGELIEGEQVYKQDSWIRLPIAEHVPIKAGVEGATIYLKTGHLVQIIGLETDEV
ncbi:MULTISPECIES: cupin domain-containing protein [unclassified Psychrobacter]|uniref:cupin domain-containing protein n=1 Tax=unclassified Psychrobacter TaxID=196806 RepID=UPI0025B28533|nr:MULTISPECIES: cupin domain-containing protein [unclassified Psychrobacter]MDN3453968.1 cupin domain-containing protein [Psychrobacter sp. APC 3350]MDN3503244.1 cupin domain-containing protein [Psychrobacter sp. 5A.1]